MVMTKKRQTKTIDPEELAAMIANNLNVPDTLPSRDDGNSVPKTLGRYPVLRLLGSGGMGSVYLAFDRQLEREIAIKVVRKEFAQDSFSLDRFNREAKIAAAIDHPNIVKIFDWGTDEKEGNFIVLEYIKGETLSDKLRKEGPMNAVLAIDITARLAQSFCAMNQKHIVHRDIKPGNILLSDAGEVKLTDLGIAKKYTGSPERVLTQGGSPGTPDFMAPEQKNSSQVDVRADIYSLGKTLFFLLTGRCDVDAAALKNTLAQAQFSGDDDAIIGKNEQLAEKINSIIQKMTEVDRSQRYQTPEELLADLQALQMSGSTPSNGQAWRYLLAGAVAIVLLALLIVLYLQNDTNDFSEKITGSTYPKTEDRIQTTLSMIDDISKQIHDHAVGDYWTSSPRIVLVLPFKIENNLPKGLQSRITGNQFSDVLKARTGLPVVDRDLLAVILREYDLEVSNLTHPGARLKLRQILPASILLEGTARKNSTHFILNVKAVNVETTEILGFVEEEMPLKDVAQSNNLFHSMAHRIASLIRHSFPIQGKVLSVDGETLEINLGRYHGLQKEATFQVRKAIETAPGFFNPEKKLITTGVVTQVEKFNAYLSVQEHVAQHIKPGMLVISE